MNDLPAPLVHAEVDIQSYPYMPLDVRRLRDSDLAALESPEACWAAVLLWSASWHQVPAASLPDDDKVLANLAGYGRVVKEWLKVRVGALRGWVKCSDFRLYHPVVAEKAIEVWKSRQGDGGYRKFREEVFERDNHACVYCGATQVEFHLDHVIPRSRGGLDKIDNLATACVPCNLSKAAKPLHLWRRT